MNAALPSPPAEPAVRLVSVQVDAESDLIEANLEAPSAGDVVEGLWLPLAGWAISPDGAPIEILVAHGRRPVDSAPCLISRPDVGDAYPGVERAHTAGFSFASSVLQLPREFDVRISALVNGGNIPFAEIRGFRRALDPVAELPLAPLPITTLGRSGSTLFTTLLGKHPAIAAFRPSAFDSRPFAYWLEAALALAAPQSRMRLLDSTGSDEHWWLGRQPAPVESFGMLDPRLRDVLLGRSLDKLLQDAVNRAAQLAQALTRVDGKRNLRYAAEKCWPGSVPRLLSELCPSAKEIFLVRDFRDGLASVLAFNAKRGYSTFGRQEVQTDEEFVDRWAIDVEAIALSWVERRARSLVVRYEDLVSDPHEVLAGVLTYLETENDSRTVNEMVKRAGTALEEARSLHETSPGVKASVGRWQRDLPKSIQQRCEEAFARSLELFGYV